MIVRARDAMKSCSIVSVQVNVGCGWRDGVIVSCVCGVCKAISLRGNDVTSTGVPV